MTTKPSKAGKPAKRTSKATPSAPEALGAADGAPCVWNTLGVATQFGITPARVTRSYAAGEIKSSVRTLGGDLRPRLAFTLLDMQGFADVLIARSSRDGGDKNVLKAAQKFLRGE